MRARIRLNGDGILVVCLGLALLFIGVLADNAIVSLWGQVVLGTIALAWPLTLRDAMRVQRGALEIACGDPRGPGGAILAGSDLVLPLTIRNPSARFTARVSVTPAASRALAIHPSEEIRTIGPGRALEWSLAARALRVGPAALHGVHVRVAGPAGLFAATTWCPLSIRFKILPRAAALGRRGKRLFTVAANRDALSPASQPVRGFGSDIRELRDHVPGDPFKHIAWKASARRQLLASRGGSAPLVVKEFDSEVSLSVYTLLDIGASMRWGPAGQAPLDAGIDLALHLAKTVSPGRDRYGLVSFDHEVFGFTRASAGHGTSHQIAAHLLELNAVVQEGFTEALTLRDLVGRVAEFMKVQDGVDLTLPDLGDRMAALGPWDESAVVARAETWLGDHTAELRSLSHYVGPPSPERAAAALRMFCRLRAIDLPYRVDAVPAPRHPGIEQAVQKAIEDRGGPHTLVIITDLVGTDDAAQLMPVVRLARRHRHRLMFVVPEVPPAQPAEDASALERSLVDLFVEDAERRRDRIAAGLMRSGVTVHRSADPAVLLRSGAHGGRVTRRRAVAR